MASAHARAIVDLLVNDPAGWVRDEFRLTHAETGISIWVANHAYALRLDGIGIACFRPPKLSWLDRRLIWKYAKRFKWHDPLPGELTRRIENYLHVLPATEEHHGGR